LVYYCDRQSNISDKIIDQIQKKATGGEVMKGRLSSDLLRGHTDTIVLGILMKGDSYGYEIYKTILDKTAYQYELKEATLYSSYRRLEKEGFIISYWGDESQGGRRKYYRITDKGKKQYLQNKLDWEFTQEMLNRLLEED
jgi:DNA-binding PadR family transcriptional regulator